jgi:hypothetical protein
MIYPIFYLFGQIDELVKKKINFPLKVEREGRIRGLGSERRKMVRQAAPIREKTRARVLAHATQNCTLA